MYVVFLSKIEPNVGEKSWWQVTLVFNNGCHDYSFPWNLLTIIFFLFGLESVFRAQHHSARSDGNEKVSIKCKLPTISISYR